MKVLLALQLAAAGKGAGECWEWRGARFDPDGYGRLDHGRYGDPERKNYLAHRLVYELHSREMLTTDDVVMHSCDNKPCVNPRHLSKGTHALNSADMVAKARNPRGSAKFNHKLREADIPEIRSRRAGGETLASIAATFGVHSSAIHHVISGRQWRHV